MYYKLDEANKEYLEDVQNITDVDYEVKGDFIEVENLMIALKDMVVEYENLKEKFEDYKTSSIDYEPYDEWVDYQLTTK